MDVETTPRERRRVITVIGEAEYDKVLRDKRLMGLVDDEESLLISLRRALQSTDPILVGLRNGNLIRAGAVLVQSPFVNERYVYFEDAVAAFCLEKYLHISQISALLGAESVVIGHDTDDKVDVSVETGEDVKAGVHRVNSSLAHRIRTELQSQLALSDTFVGGVADVGAARARADKLGLANDAQVASLIEARAGANPLRKRTLNVNLVREAQHNLSIAARYAAVGGVAAAVKADVKRQRVDKLRVTVSIGISFAAVGPSRDE